MLAHTRSTVIMLLLRCAVQHSKQQMQNANNAQIAKHVTRNENGLLLCIAINAMWGDVQVESITMHVSTEADEDGDLAVNWDCSKLQNSGGCDMGSLLMRGRNDAVHDALCAAGFSESAASVSGGDMGSLLMRGRNDAVGAVMRRFYSDSEFDDAVHDALCAAGFSESAASVSGGEWGMQDEGRASYDAYSIADEVRAAMQVQA